MNWISVSDRLPEVGADGYSSPVLVYHGHGCLPEIATYSPDNTTILRGTRKKTRTHWHSIVFYNDTDRNGPALEPTHWCKIVLPDD